MYAYYLPAGLTGPVRVVELDASGFREAYLVGGDPDISEPPTVSVAAPFAARAHALALATRPKDNSPTGPGDVARVLVGGEGLVRVSVTALADAFGVSADSVSSSIMDGSLSLSDGHAPVAYEPAVDGIVFFAAPADHVFSDERHFFVRLTGGGASLSRTW